jgi:hypothetical protein
MVSNGTRATGITENERQPAKVGQSFGRCLFVVKDNSAIGYSKIKWSAVKLAHPGDLAAVALGSSH